MLYVFFANKSASERSRRKWRRNESERRIEDGVAKRASLARRREIYFDIFRHLFSRSNSSNVCFARVKGGKAAAVVAAVEKMLLFSTMDGQLLMLLCCCCYSAIAPVERVNFLFKVHSHKTKAKYAREPLEICLMIAGKEKFIATFFSLCAKEREGEKRGQKGILFISQKRKHACEAIIITFCCNKLPHGIMMQKNRE